MSLETGESKQEGIAGVFSTLESKLVGTGTTARKTLHKTYWYCEEVMDGPDAGKFTAQPLNKNYVPSGIMTTVERERFLDAFSPEPEFYLSKVYPQMRTLQKTLAKAERHRHNKEFYTAEVEYNKAIILDDKNVRANFGLGLVYMERGDSEKAKDIFQRLVQLDSAFRPEHKHLFNGFGIRLRKNMMFDEAREYYEKAAAITQDDENLFYNIARACFEKHEWGEAVQYLLKCLTLNPLHKAAVSFLMGLLRSQMVPDELKAQSVQALQTARDALQTAGKQVEPALESYFGKDTSAPGKRA